MLNYTTMLAAIQRTLGTEALYSPKMASAVELWGRMYRGKAPWNAGNILSAGIASAVASETARLITVELKSELNGSAVLQDTYGRTLLPKLRRFTEYGAAAGSLVLKPIVSGNSIITQFIPAGSFFPLEFDAAGEITKCVFCDRMRKGQTYYTLLEIHSISDGLLTVENRLFRSGWDGALGSQVPLAEVPQWADKSPSEQMEGLDRLPFGLLRMPNANHIEESSSLGVSVYGRAAELIYEADRRYSDICWEYQAKQAAVHIGQGMLDYDKETDTYRVPDNFDRLYRPVSYERGLQDRPLIDVYSPEIRASAYFEGYNAQLRMIEFACSLAYGTISDPETVDKTATEIEASKQRSFSFISDCQAALEYALRDWADAALFWARLYGLETASAVDMKFEWGDSITSEPDKEREEDRKDVAMGVMSLAEYRAKYYDEDIETAAANLPDAPGVIA